ncbi:adenylylsulfate kinase [Anseongella ginsenosidimutans]|uniref:Adenylyl-sulfate kinase n=1 Tax=Anseongella ginsenosidimutans TaxID=496056 RepID=A0A4R3KQ64_9SPHI|nr:adenylyl-sulfate kinase [Anseongella ginsenosidimutans]QEC52167.1 adenylyl-sulfate kinase [Anseongella ginsenosidimutans]TCS86707.1 adenylylsulfate kinase [Anseongella ginsenosidimutans]
MGSKEHSAEGLYIIPHKHKVTGEDRMRRKGHRPLLIWFTGLSGSGKSTLSGLLEQELFERQVHTYLLDGDNVRKGLNKDLGFSKECRTENIRRIGETANLMLDAGLVVLAAFVSPFRKDRETVRELVGPENFLEVFVDCPLKVCEQRDVKGLYKKARDGKIQDFTGVSSPFEAPERPDVHIRTSEQTLEVSLNELIQAVLPKIKIK